VVKEKIVYFFFWAMALVQMMFGVSVISDPEAQMLQGFVAAPIGGAKIVQFGITVFNSTLNTFNLI
jgi:hypothetical protein